jgi:hypothetical protein
MPFKRNRYPGVEGKTVENIETTHEQQFIYVHIRFTDKTAVSISLTSEAILYHSALYDETTGDQEVLREYVLPDRIR